jgi:cytochrome c oxidase cbb3-type subunit I/II
MIRPMVSEKLRYGDPSRAEESIYDHPFQWGSKRTGPDLARIGQKYPDLWHYRHMRNPREVVPQSIMPTYGWLLKDKTNFAILSKKLSVMKMLGVPYTDEEIANAPDLAMKQALEITARLREQGAPQADERMEIVSLIAYLQSLGQLQIKAGGK